MIVVMTSCAPVLRLEEADEAAPDRAAEDAGEQRDEQVDDRRQVPGEADVAGAIAPMISWPCTPMLNRPARKATRDGEPAEDQRGGVDQRVGDRAEDRHAAVGVQRVGVEDRAAEQRRVAAEIAFQRVAERVAGRWVK